MRVGVRQLTLHGVLVRKRLAGESDRVVEILSVESGRVAVLARGARRSKKRFPGTLDLFTSLAIECTVRPGLWVLDAADVVDRRLGIRQSWERVARASLLTEAASVLAPEQQPAEALCRALVLGLDALERGELESAALAYVGLLAGAGLAPSAARCGRCDRRQPPQVAVEPRQGRLLCPACAGALPLVPAAAWSEPVQLSAAEARALERGVIGLVEAHLGRTLQSARALLGTSPR